MGPPGMAVRFAEVACDPQQSACQLSCNSDERLLNVLGMGGAAGAIALADERSGSIATPRDAAMKVVVACIRK